MMFNIKKMQLYLCIQILASAVLSITVPKQRSESIIKNKYFVLNRCFIPNF